MATASAKKRAAKKSAVKAADQALSGSMVESIHRELRDMAINFRFLPGERLNEAILAKELGVSRTPLREALNRLMAEGFLTFSVNHGFFRKSLDVKEIFDLYELRQQMEMSAVRLAVQRASDEQLMDLERFCKISAKDNVERALDQVIALDEEFHDRIVTLTGNNEMREALRNINERIHYVRWIDMTGHRPETQKQHAGIVRCLRDRNTEEGMRLIGEHIGQRLDQIVGKVERSYGRIYMSAGRHSASESSYS